MQENEKQAPAESVEERQAEEFADEMQAEPRNIDGEPGVATPEEEAASEAVENQVPAEPVEERQAEPHNIDGESGLATSEEEAASEAVENQNQAEPVEERQAEEFADEMQAEPRNIDGEPGVATPEEEAVSEAVESHVSAVFAGEMQSEPHNIDGEPGIAPPEEEAAATGVGSSPATESPETPAPARESLSADEILAPDAASEQPKWAAEDAELTAMLEAVIYITDEPLTLEQMAAAFEQPRDRIKRLLSDLVAEWQKPHHGLSIREVAGGYKMTTKPEHHEAVRQFVKNLKPAMKLSLPALETLAVIAYKQPVTAPVIMDIRGVQGAGVLKTLIDRKLIAPAGRKNVIGKPILYKTTREFLVQFGLKDLSELPSVKEFEELARFATPEPETAPPASAPERPAARAPNPAAETAASEVAEEATEAPSPTATQKAEPAAQSEEPQPEPVPEPVTE